jgi:hypothetical protein
VKKILDIQYRVLSLPTALLVSLRKARDAGNATNLSFIADAVATHLPRFLDEFHTLGFDHLKGSKRPSRLPFSEQSGTMKLLRAASNETHLPVVMLLSLCLAAATKTGAQSRKRRGRRKKNGNETAAD